jgi:hypothetical protein
LASSAATCFFLLTALFFQLCSILILDRLCQIFCGKQHC